MLLDIVLCRKEYLYYHLPSQNIFTLSTPTPMYGKSLIIKENSYKINAYSE
ncbi:hypothetical protein [Prevotella pallens]